MVDPLAEVVELLQPGALLSKLATGSGAWSVTRHPTGQPFYCVVLEGGSRCHVDGHEPLELKPGDFVLIPSGFGFEMSGLVEAPGQQVDPQTATALLEEIRHGDPAAPVNARLLIGHFRLGSPDAALLVSMLPRLVHIRGEPRLSTLVHMVSEEARGQRPARDMVLQRLLEVLLIEALRSGRGTAASSGLLRGLADPRLAPAIRRMHEAPAHPWTVALLAREAALSRSAFFERFNRALGVAPMEYLLFWRMALAKRLLQRREGNVAEIAERVGYGSAATFSTAFTRTVGMPPAQYGRFAAAAAQA